MTVTDSFTEAKYRAMTVTTYKLTWLKQLLIDLDLSYPEPFAYIVTINLLFILSIIPFFMNIPSILRLTVTLFKKRFALV